MASTAASRASKRDRINKQEKIIQFIPGMLKRQAPVVLAVCAIPAASALSNTLFA